MNTKTYLYDGVNIIPGIPLAGIAGGSLITVDMDTDPPMIIEVTPVTAQQVQINVVAGPLSDEAPPAEE